MRYKTVREFDSPVRSRRGVRAQSREWRVGSFARFDADRERRTATPEVILAEGKSSAHLFELLRALRRRRRGALVSRPTPSQSVELRRFASEEGGLTSTADGRLWVLTGPFGRGLPAGTVAIVAAGTSDVPTAEEAAGVLEAVGVHVVRSYDVGVAGLHRLLRAVARLERARPKAYIALAGREGALPTVLAGLVRAPVVAVPTSAGYGRAGAGEAALNALLQSCAPVAVVNIDAAVPAALIALKILASASRRRG